jgi:hypothetical protein
MADNAGETVNAAAPVAEEVPEDAAAADGDDHVPEEENTAHFEPVVRLRSRGSEFC